MRQIGSLIIPIFFLLPSAAQTMGHELPLSDSALSFSGVIDFSTGEIMTGMYMAMKGNGSYDINYPTAIDHAWFGEPLARLNLLFRPDEKISVSIGFEAGILLTTFPANLKTAVSSNGMTSVLPQYMDWRLHQAMGSFSLLDNEGTSATLSAGLMPYKYNPEVRNLGEFLFRSGTYPFFLVNSFNFPLARLTGLRLKYTRKSGNIKFTFDQFVRLERDFPPLNDLSLTSIVGINLMKVVDIGAGVDFARLIAWDSRITTPRGACYVTSPAGDTGYYTFKGTKLMAHATIDPLAWLRDDEESFFSRLAGENGGKLYGEIAIIGLANYPASHEIIGIGDSINLWGYTKITERMPWMAGINIPLWKLLDVCAFEIERYPAPYPNDYSQAFYNRALPIPAWLRNYRNDTTGYGSGVYSIKRWYWSLYMKKQIVKHVCLLGQVSRDHMRWEVNLGNEINYATEEIMPKPGQWAWRLGMLFEF